MTWTGLTSFIDLVFGNLVIPLIIVMIQININ